MDAVEDGKVEMVACERLIGEVRRGLEGSYFRKRLPAEDRATVLAGLERIAVTRTTRSHPPRCCVIPMTTTCLPLPARRTQRQS